jgi:Tol biopolymer transport system component/predicted Ser/Thr protein kinase
MVGETIAHYRVLEKLGEGGMGAVFKALDTHLERLVAIKVLPADKVADPERRRRFVQEARAASALNHRNIITIHDVAAHDDVHFIAMEYVQGRTLSGAIGRDGLPIRDVLNYGIQIADALAAAHAAGIVHRDLKPANVMITAQSTVKVLDFGLAKLTEAAPASTETATRAADGPLSAVGTIVGTTAYMSPEQVEGRKLDARSDIFAFGAVLYEMATGRRAFLRESTIATLSAILRDEPPPPSEVVPRVPRELQRIVLRCLRKSADERYQHIGDVKIALQDLKADLSDGLAGSRRDPKPVAGVRRWLPVAAALVLGVALAAGAIRWWPRPTATMAGPLASVPLTTYPGQELYPSLSPDGTQVAFAWDGEHQDNFDIYVKLVGPGAPLRLTTNPAVDTSPAWSPDGRWIAFVRLISPGRGALILLPALGGPERQLAEVFASPFLAGGTGRIAAWSPTSASLIVMAGGSPAEPQGLFALSVATGERHRLTSLPKTGWMDTAPAISPDGRTLAFTRFASFGISDLYRLRLDGGLRPAGELERVTRQNRYVNAPAWTPDGRRLVFGYGSMGSERLFAIDAADIPTEGRQPQMTSILDRAALPSIARVATGDRGRMVYAQSHFDAGIWRLELPQRNGTSTPSEAKATPFVLSTVQEFQPQYSPDGERVAFVSRSSGAAEIWACDKNGANLVQLTAAAWPETANPRWSPDGLHLVFQARPEGNGDIFTIPATGGAPRRVTDDPADDWGNWWSRDGQWIYFGSVRSGRFEIWKAPSGGGPAVQVTKNGGIGPVVSPDGQTLYFTRGTAFWRHNLESGEESRVLPFLSDWSRVVVTTTGIYFNRSQAIEGPRESGEYLIEFLDFRTGAIQTIARLDKPLFIGMTASPDERYLLFAQIDQTGADLMLVDPLPGR